MVLLTSFTYVCKGCYHFFLACMLNYPKLHIIIYSTRQNTGPPFYHAWLHHHKYHFTSNGCVPGNIWKWFIVQFSAFLAALRTAFIMKDTSSSCISWCHWQTQIFKWTTRRPWSWDGLAQYPFYWWTQTDRQTENTNTSKMEENTYGGLKDLYPSQKSQSIPFFSFGVWIYSFLFDCHRATDMLHPAEKL